MIYVYTLRSTHRRGVDGRYNRTYKDRRHNLRLSHRSNITNSVCYTVVQEEFVEKEREVCTESD